MSSWRETLPREWPPLMELPQEILPPESSPFDVYTLWHVSPPCSYSPFVQLVVYLFVPVVKLMAKRFQRHPVGSPVKEKASRLSPFPGSANIFRDGRTHARTHAQLKSYIRDDYYLQLHLHPWYSVLTLGMTVQWGWTLTIATLLDQTTVL